MRWLFWKPYFQSVNITRQQRVEPQLIVDVLRPFIYFRYSAIYTQSLKSFDARSIWYVMQNEIYQIALRQRYIKKFFLYICTTGTTLVHHEMFKINSYLCEVLIYHLKLS